MASTVTSPPAAGSDIQRAIPWAMIGWFALLLVICFAPVLLNMAGEWMTDDDMGHGIFVPFVVGWIVWNSRDTLLRLPAKPNNWGLVLLLIGALQVAVGTLGAELFISRVAFIVSLCGVLLYLGGTALIRALAFPLFLLLFMIRIPAIIFNQITFPLQLFASSVAETALWNVFFIPVLREGNVIHMADRTLSVVEACSGIRSLLSLSFLSLVYAYVFDSKVWMRAALLVATIPIAVGANAVRVTLTGLISQYRPELAEGAFHTAEGGIIFALALAMLVFTHTFINFIYRRFKPKA